MLAVPEEKPAEVTRGQSNVSGIAAAGARDPGSSGGAASVLGKGERTILTAIAQRPTGATHAGIAVLTGYKETSRRTYLQRLTAAGFVRQEGDRFNATSEGVVALGGVDILPTGPKLIDYWLERLGEGESTVFHAVVAAGNIPISELQDRTGYKETSVRTYVQRLAARELVNNERGIVRLAKELLA